MADYKFRDVGDDFTIQVDNGSVTTHSGNSQAAATAIGSIIRVQTFYPYFEVAIDKTVHNIFINDVNVTANSVSSIVASLNEDVFVSSGTVEVGGNGGGGLTLASPDGSIWGLTVTNAGALDPVKLAASGEGGTIHVFAANDTEWNLTISNEGVLSTTQI